MNKKFLIIPILILILTLCGCGKSYPELPDEPIAFEMGTFEDTKHDSALFGTLEYNGRTYISYGTINNSFKRGDVDQCIGYIVMDENSASTTDSNDTNLRVYTLIGDTNHNFLMEYDNGTSLMNQPSLWRATDTKGMDIKIPEYIEDLGYDFWK